MVATLEELSEALSSYVMRAAEKLREQAVFAGPLQVFVMTNQFRIDDAQYSNGIVIPLPNLSNNNPLNLVQAALFKLKAIYRRGYLYKKTGVMLLDLAPAGKTQASLFDPMEEQAKHSEALMATLDGLNKRFGRDTLCVAAAGTRKRWAAKAENRTPCYTTRWGELPKAFAR